MRGAFCNTPGRRCEPLQIARLEPEITPSMEEEDEARVGRQPEAETEEEDHAHGDFENTKRRGSAGAAGSMGKHSAYAGAVRLPPWSLLRACRAAGVSATCIIAICSEGDNSAAGEARFALCSPRHVFHFVCTSRF